MTGTATQRRRIAFREVNARGTSAYDPSLQRHHLLPRQLVGHSGLKKLFSDDLRQAIGFDDFRANGLLLPAQDSAVIRLGLPLHRGPHRSYNAMVIERIGQIEQGWSQRRALSPERSRDEAVMRLQLLQRALRRSLLDTRRRRVLNRFDPLGHGVDFVELDAMAEALWGMTEPA